MYLHNALYYHTVTFSGPLCALHIGCIGPTFAFWVRSTCWVRQSRSASRDETLMGDVKSNLGNADVCVLMASSRAKCYDAAILHV